MYIYVAVATAAATNGRGFIADAAIIPCKVPRPRFLFSLLGLVFSSSIPVRWPKIQEYDRTRIGFAVENRAMTVNTFLPTQSTRGRGKKLINPLPPPPPLFALYKTDVDPGDYRHCGHE